MTPPPSLDALIVSAEATAALQAGGLAIERAEPAYVRHKPHETTIIAYRLALTQANATWGYAVWCEDAARAEQIHQKARTLGPRTSAAGPGLSRIDANTVFYAFPNDARLRRLRWYTDPRKLKRSLEPLTEVGERISGSRTTVEVLRYKPERRVVTRVELATTSHTRALLVRYSTRRQARHLSRVAIHLRGGGISTPAPVAQLEGGRVTVDEYTEGVQLYDAVRAGTVEPVTLANAIVDFHATPAPRWTAQRTAADDMERVVTGLADLGSWHRTLSGPAGQLAAALRRHLPPAAGRTVLLHGDLHTKNLLAHDDRISFIDLERVATGPAAIDLGFLNAHAIALGLRQLGWSPNAQQHARLATDHYQSVTHMIAPSELAWHTSLGLAEQALLVARHLEPQWQHTSASLLHLAHHHLEKQQAPTPIIAQ